MKYEKTTLPNGLTVIAHRDQSSPIAAVNVLYKVGARNENPERTGFAHLFEHLMFSGSKNVKSFDNELQIVGGENNAFTCNDYTNYYITLPKDNIETALWLESDRMMHANITQHNLDVQRNVVIEEFNQRYLNQPYGDITLLLRPLAFKVHPYQWATIGKNIDHVKNATINDVQKFYNAFYSPNNAIVSIVADIEPEKIFKLVEKWFADIPAKTAPDNNIPKEPEQTQARSQTVYRNVPADMIYKAYKMCNRLNADYYTCDLISDILSTGKSSRLYKKLVKDENIFSSVNAYILGDMDEGLLIVYGCLLPNVDMITAENALQREIDKMRTQAIEERELEKVKNRVESSQIFAETSILNKAMILGYYEMLNRLDLINTELDCYRKISVGDVLRVSRQIFAEEKCSTLYYLRNKNEK